jgi:hypothetical protein
MRIAATVGGIKRGEEESEVVSKFCFVSHPDVRSGHEVSRMWQKQEPALQLQVARCLRLE